MDQSRYLKGVGKQVSAETDVNFLWGQCHEMGLDRLEEIDYALQALQLNPEDTQMRDIVLEAIANFRFLQTVAPDPFRETAPLPLDDLSGELLVGRTANGGIYGINPDDLCRHLLLIGASGTGKSVVLIQLAAMYLLRRSNAARDHGGKEEFPGADGGVG